MERGMSSTSLERTPRMVMSMKMKPAGTRRPQWLLSVQGQASWLPAAQLPPTEEREPARCQVNVLLCACCAGGGSRPSATARGTHLR